MLRKLHWLLLVTLLALDFPPALVRADDRALEGKNQPFAPIEPPAWVFGVSRMAFLAPSQLDLAAAAGVQVVHTNLVWPYYPLKRDGGGLTADDSAHLRDLVEGCHRRGMKLVLGLPPFPPSALVKEHPDWRVHPDQTGAILKLEPKEADLGTRVGCNLGPWGNYLIEVLAELMRDFGIDGYSFDGNYHPPICFCPACQQAYRQETGAELPAKVNLAELGYRRYLAWRGDKLEDHYRRMQARLKAINKDAVLMSWTVNAGRYGHLLTSPRVMSTRLNLLFDLPMQEWWLDETNLGPSVAPAFGAAYLRGIMGGRPCASEPYMMSRGNPYGTDSFPAFERVTRTLLATTQGSLAPQSFGWPGHEGSTRDALRAIAERERWILNARPMPWAALLVSEQTRQYVAYKDIAARYLPHLFGTFRAALEEHRALDLINDWDLTPERLARYRVLVLANAAALSDAQVQAVRAFVAAGGGLVATCETSLCDELGRAHPDFALADLFGVSFQGMSAAPRPGSGAPGLSDNGIDEAHWSKRSAVGPLTWKDHPLARGARLDALVPTHSVTFRGPLCRVSEPASAAEVAARIKPDGTDGNALPALIAREQGAGRVVYLAAGLDAALWSYSYPYQRLLLSSALDWAARQPFPISVDAPMCVQSTFFEQQASGGRRVVIHLFNGIDTAAHHGQPGLDVPLREEAVPIHGIKVRFDDLAPRSFHVEPGGISPTVRRQGATTIVELPPLEVHALLVGELP
jgi:hypothetical protein